MELFKRWIKKPNVIVCIALVVIILAAYGQVYDFELTTRDDNNYIINNPAVQAGITSHTVRWALTTNYEANWYPLTWISLMLDTDVGRMLSSADIGFGTNNSGLFHLTNVFLHCLATVLLFLVLSRATGMRWPSMAVAALFAVHPMNVESVAWASERKNVLSAVFWMLTMWKYLDYVEKPTLRRYLWVVLCFVMGLMSKSTLVTLPLALLTMDVWPLRRLDLSQPRSERFAVLKKLVVEKLPLFGLAGVLCVITVWATRTGGAIALGQAVSLGLSMENALVSYVDYILMMFRPVGLACIYPYPDAISPTKVGGAALLLVVATVLAMRSARRRPWVTMGWLWYLITLVPVIGFVQVGGQALTDHHAYIPYIGLFTVVAWWIVPAKRPARYQIVLLTALWGAILVALWIGAYRQIGYWRNSEILYTRAIAVTPRNPIAHNGLGFLLAERGEYEEAIYHFRMATKEQPDDIEARYNGATALIKLQRYEEAEADLKCVIRQAPTYVPAHNTLGVLFAIENRRQEALHEWRESLRINPRDPDALGYLSRVGEAPGD